MDKVKSIKILLQDGTYTDYIPIGADASNIETSDGSDVQTVLDTAVDALTWESDV